MNIETIKEFYKKKGYNLLTDKWINNCTLMIIEKDGYYAMQSYGNFQQGKKPSWFSFHNPYAEENIRTYIRNRYTENTEIVNIRRIKKKHHNQFLITLKCEKCGKIYKQKFDDIRKPEKTSLLCNECNKIIRGKKRRKDKNIIIDCFKEQGYDIFPNQELVRSNQLKVKDKNGYIGYISYYNIKRGRKMSPFETRGNLDNYIYNMNNWCKLNGITSKAIKFSDNNTHTRETILFQCECGNYFETTKIAFCYGKYRCDECTAKLSRYEILIKNYLQEKNIDFIYQYRIFSCRDVLPLPFDFQLKEYNALIEVDGEGHERPCNFNQISNEQALITYQATIKHDKIKNDYCKQYNIPLLRISYKDIRNSENYKTLIDRFILECSNSRYGSTFGTSRQGSTRLEDDRC